MVIYLRNIDKYSFTYKLINEINIIKLNVFNK